ncbi:hypothetical protein BLJAPNOD_01581 [Ensifer sp. M14]|nr:hypothetical protein BLJAPNOD_01581 [Ensifer sp. M14]
MVVVVDVVAVDVVERVKREGMVMTKYHRQSMIFRSGVGLVLLGLSTYAGVTVAAESEPPELADYISPTDPPTFDDPDKAVSAFKEAMSSSDFGKLAALLGLDAEKLKAGEGVMDTYEQIKAGAAKKVVLMDAGDNKIIQVGDQLWPLPFPIVKGDDGKWAFDTYAGIEEIINRRVGENELEAINTVRAYVDAQEEYTQEDHDGDGVFEYAQKLISSEGKTDGLYWPVEQGDGDSPAGDLSQAQLDKAKADEGYYGYRFKILTRQGGNIAGGSYDYVINGNMIAGFGLVAWPVKYGETGIHTFVVNRNGIVYQADLGAGTDAMARDIKQFNPNDNWTITED